MFAPPGTFALLAAISLRARKPLNVGVVARLSRMTTVLGPGGFRTGHFVIWSRLPAYLPFITASPASRTDSLAETAGRAHLSTAKF